LGIRLNFEASMLTTGVDNPLDKSSWSNFTTNPLLAPPTNANAAAIATKVDPRPNSYTWEPQQGMNNVAKYTHSIINETSYLYTGVHFSYGGGYYSTSKTGEWGRDYRYPLARFFTGINRLEEGLPLVLRRNATGAFSSTFSISGTARGWHLTRVSGLISIPTDIIWLAESWTRDRITNDWRKGENLDWVPDSEDAVPLSSEKGWWAIKAGKTLDPEYTTGTSPLCVYYELFETEGGTVYPLGFIRLAETTAIESLTGVDIPAHANFIPHDRVAWSGDGGYYRRNYSVELLDTMMFLAPKTIDTSLNTAIVGAGEYNRLHPADYSITSVFIYEYIEYLHYQNPNLGTIGGTEATDYQNYAPVTIEYKRASMSKEGDGPNDGWLVAGTVLRNGSTYTYTPIYAGAPQLQTPAATMSATNQLILPYDTYELRFLHSNNRYQVDIDARFKVQLNSTEHVLSILKEVDEATLVNVSSFVVRDDNNIIQNTRDHSQIWVNNGVNNGSPAETLKRQIMEHDFLRFDTKYANFGTATYVAGDTAVMHYSSQVHLLRMPSGSNLSKTASPTEDKQNDPVFEMHENGAYVLDEDGEPIPVYLKDSEGEILRDHTGEPIQATQHIMVSRQQLEAYEFVQYDPSDVLGADASHAQRVAYLEEDGLITRQMTGTFYDLLPAGTSIRELEVRTYFAGNSWADGNSRILATDDYTVQLIANWQGSGRTMLIVEIKAPENQSFYDLPTANGGNPIRGPNYHVVVGDNYHTLYTGFMLRFVLVTTYENIYDRLFNNAYNSINLAAYRSAIGTRLQGAPANAPDPLTSNSAFAYFRSLQSAPGEATRDDGNFDTIYDSAGVSFVAPAIAVDGIYKNVKSEKDVVFTAKTETVPGGLYSYQLRFQGSRIAGEFSRNVVLYDVLETRGKWKGTIESVDVRDIRAKGIAVEVYYSTIPNLLPIDIVGGYARATEQADFSAVITIDDETIPVWQYAILEDGEFWTVHAGLQKSITAIAIDLSRRTTPALTDPDKNDGTGGWLYTFRDGDSAAAVINMRAPNRGDEQIEEIILAQLQAMNYIGYAKRLLDDQEKDVPAAAISTHTSVTIREAIFDISKSADPASGSEAKPRPVNPGEIIEYTISLHNKDLFPVSGVKAEDILPAGVTILNEDEHRIRYYYGTDPRTAVVMPLYDEDNPLATSVDRDEQKLSFVIADIRALQTANIIIPVRIEEEVGPIVNNAVLLEINGGEYETISNAVYHQIYPSLVLKAQKELEGRDLRMLPSGRGEFNFVITETTDWKKDPAQLQTVTATHDAEGKVVFADLFFTEPGSYTFAVSEVSGSLSGITYDSTVFTVTVVVTKSSEDESFIISEVLVDGEKDGEILFSNTFIPPKIELNLQTPASATLPLASVI
ncbi:MAG: hypothetical protein FWE76_06535, partial [Symbiobacteriaceae bacterium]|nr:hypothetical protein [Symbiobacteriaceae bacterium]